MFLKEEARKGERLMSRGLTGKTGAFIKMGGFGFGGWGGGLGGGGGWFCGSRGTEGAGVEPGEK